MTIEKTIEDMLPKSLDDIIRQRRDQCSIRLAATQELMTLVPMVSKMMEPMQVKAILDDWRVICITHQEQRHFFLTGMRRDRNRITMTSNIKSVDFASNRVLTNNSIYQLGKRGDDEPEVGVLLHICATLHEWRLGSGFGVPAIFY